MKQKGFFDENDRLEEISKLGDPLEKLNNHINWESLRGILTRTFQKEVKGPGGRPPFDYVMTFKILALRKLYNLGDDKTEYLIKDRLSFQRFLGLQLCGTVPDAKTIWLFREELNAANILDAVFYRFAEQLEKKGIITRSGSIVDAAFVDVPKQRNARKENEEIKEGKTPVEWEDPENRHKKAQKDVDERRAAKNKEKHYGYKNHINVDEKSKIITKYTAAGAEVHDSQELKNLIDEKKDKRVYGDSAYTGEEAQSCIPDTIQNGIHEKGYRDHPLTKTQIRNNTAKPHIRVRVGHVFAAVNHFGGIFIRAIGIRRGRFQIGLMNLTYNLTRYTYLMEANT